MSSKTGVVIGLVATFVLELVFLYVIPNTAGAQFLDISVVPAVSCDRMSGVMMSISNSYLLPLVMSYDGPDLGLDITRASDGVKIHHASFLSEELHDEEEGIHHLARIPPGKYKFLLNFEDSLQFFNSGGKLPEITYASTDPEALRQTYVLSGTAFGLQLKPGSTSGDALALENGPNQSQCPS